MARRGRMGRGVAPTEKAKDFKETMKKLIRYMASFKIQIFFVAVFAICGTIFNIAGPKILGKATTEIFNGLVSKVSGGIRHGFWKNRNDSGDSIESVSDQCSVQPDPGIPDDRCIAEDNL